MNIWLPAAFMGGFSILGGAPQADFHANTAISGPKRASKPWKMRQNGINAREIEVLEAF